MDDVKKYLKQLELAPAEEALPDYEMFESSSDESIETPSYLNYKSLNSFSENVPKQSQEDVLNSLLLAQRAASKAFPEENQMEEWYTLYFDVLKKLGWLINARDFSLYEESSDQFDLDKAIISILEDLVTGQQINVLMKSLNLIKSLGEDDKRFVAFSKNTETHGRGNFQLGLTEDENGNISIIGSGFILESEAKLTRILFIKIDKERIKLKFNFYKANLVASVYQNYREIVKQKLADSKDFIASLDI